MTDMHVEWSLETLEDPQFSPMLPDDWKLDDVVLTYNNGADNRCVSIGTVATYGIIYDVYRQSRNDVTVPLTIATCPLSFGTVAIIGKWQFSGRIAKGKNIILENEDKTKEAVHITSFIVDTKELAFQQIEVRVDILRNVLSKVSDPTYLLFKSPTIPPTVWETAPPHTIVYIINYRTTTSEKHSYKSVMILPKINSYDCVKNGFSSYVVRFAKKLRNKDAIIRTTFLSVIDILFGDIEVIKLANE